MPERLAFLTFNGDLAVNAQDIVSFRSLQSYDYDSEGQLVGLGPYVDAEEANSYKSLVTLRSGTSYFVPDTFEEVMERFVMLREMAVRP